MSQDTTNDYFPESDDYIYFFSAVACCIIVNFLWIMQFKQIYSDLFTKDRKSVSYRVIVPKLTPLYKSVNIMTCFCVFCYGMTSILEVIKQGPSHLCKIEFYIVMVFFNWSKASLFSVYLLRLESTYGQSCYSYPKSLIYILLAIQWIFGAILPIICNLHSKVFVYDQDGFPDPCWGVFAHWNVIWLCAWDFGMNFGCLIAFVVPLYKTIKGIQNMNTQNDSKSVHSHRSDIKRIAIKVTILTATASITTCVALLAFTLFTFAHIFPFDWVVNSVCVVLMSPYYPDHRYFDRVCRPCLVCCPRSNIDKQSNVDKQNNAKRTNSVAMTVVSVSPPISPASPTSPPELVTNITKEDTFDINNHAIHL